MHELSIAMRVVQCAVEEARLHEGRVAAVHLKIGALSGVVVDAVRSAFELARKGTPLASANLVIEEVPLAAFCPACEVERTVVFPQLVCPVCTAQTPEIVRGRELELTALEFASP